MLRLYDYAASGNCYKVRLLLAQLDRSCDRVPIDIFGGDTLTDEFAAINPQRSVPVLEIAPARYLIESAAILFYLSDGTSLLPDGAAERAEVLRWLIYEQTDVMPAIGGLRFRLLTGRLRPDDPDAVARRDHGEQLLSFVNTHLAEHGFFAAGRYSIADIAVFGYMHTAREAGYDMARWPAVGNWIDRVAAEPRFINDLAPYPDNARRGAGRSIYGS